MTRAAGRVDIAKKSEATHTGMDEASLSDFQDESPARPADSDCDTTVEFVPDGGTCEACGEPAPRLWDDDGARLCGSCKSW